MYLISIALQWKLGHVVDRFNVQNALLWKNYTRRTFCKVPSLEIKANLGCRKKKKKKLGSSLLRQISQISFQISQAALPQANAVAAGGLSVVADASACTPVLVIRCTPWGLSSDTHSIKAVMRNSWEVRGRVEFPSEVSSKELFSLKTSYLLPVVILYFNSAIRVPFRHLRSPLPRNFPK